MNEKGFTLLEVVISLAILSMALMWILIDQSIAIKRSVRSRLLTQVIYLARSKMEETEAEMRKEGFGSFEDENCSDFDQGMYEGTERFRFCVLTEKIELPDIGFLQQKLMGSMGMGNPDGKSDDADPSTTSPLSGLLEQFMPGGADNSELQDKFSSMAGQFLGPALGMIQGVLEQAIRKVTVTVFYKAGGKERSYQLVAYFTDVGELDRSIIGGGMPSSTSTNSSGNSKSSSNKNSGGTK